MKSPRLIALGSLATLLSFAAGCSTGIDTRIAEKSEVFGKYPAEVQKNIRGGTIEPGYTTDMVYMALGKPSHVRIKDTPHGKVGIWIYNNFYPEGYEALPAKPADGQATAAADSPPQVTSSFTSPGSSDYGNVKAPKEVSSYTATDRRGYAPYQANASTFSNRTAAMEPLDVPDMDSASLYVVFYEGRVAQMKLGRN